MYVCVCVSPSRSNRWTDPAEICHEDRSRPWAGYRLFKSDLRGHPRPLEAVRGLYDGQGGQKGKKIMKYKFVRLPTNITIMTSNLTSEVIGGCWRPFLVVKSLFWGVGGKVAKNYEIKICQTTNKQ